MAKVLVSVPCARLETVLVNVDLVLQATPPPSRVSGEHVLNALARLNGPSLPARLGTSLHVTTPPLADPARYDRLREVDHS